MPLTAREEKYCQEWVKCLNKTKAAISAGYSKKTAKEQGYRLFTNAHIQARISELQKDLQAQTGITAHDVIMELAALGFWSIKDFILDNNVVRDLSKMTKQKLRPVVGIKVKETVTSTGTGENVITTKDITTELKLADKRGALVDLGRHLGVFEEDNKQKAIKIKVTRK